MNFREYLTEAKEYQKGIFTYIGEEHLAKDFIKKYIWKLVNKNELITVEDISITGYDEDENETEVTVLGHFPAPEKRWKEFGKYIEKNTKTGYIYFQGVK